MDIDDLYKDDEHTHTHTLSTLTHTKTWTHDIYIYVYTKWCMCGENNHKKNEVKL